MNDTTTRRTKREQKTPQTPTTIIDFPVPEKMTYEPEELEGFLDTIFAKARLDESILTWGVSPGKSPAYPISHRDTLKNLKRHTRPKAFYFGTSTCAPEDGELRNRLALFQGLYVVVLDDVGTKIPLEKLIDIEPTYALESSQGNYQYGFVLEEPIRAVDQASAFIKAIYSSGFTDEGGAMPTKLVRLPCGINGKKGPKEGFHVELTQWNADKTWGYDELLDALNVPYTFEQVTSDPELFKRSRTLGTSAWSPLKAVGASSKGLIDPVLEWLYEQNMVMSDAGEWVTIKCPWHKEHTNPAEDTAGYKPLGRGSDPAARGFHCFHGHCRDNKTMEFLSWIKDVSDIVASPRDMSAVLVRDWVFDSDATGAWNVSNPDHIVFTRLAGFKELFARNVWVPGSKGKSKTCAQHHLWTHAPNRVCINGVKPFTGATDLFVEQGGHLYLNTYQAPCWGNGSYDQKDVDRFLAFLEYLIPEEDDRYYFLNWLVAKIQDPCFRGTAIVMVAELQGVGRSTLGDMIGTLLGPDNKAHVNFDKLLGDTNFNEWATKPLVISDETLTVQPNAPRFNKAYEALKDFVDPRPKTVEINPKYGSKFTHSMVSSFLLFSNHRAALAIPSEDRRLYVLNNALVPAEHNYFKQLNEWLDVGDYDGKPRWARNVYRWMMEQSVDTELLLAPPEMTAAKAEMREEVNSGIDILADAIEYVIGTEGVIRIGDWEPLIRAQIYRVTNMDTDDAIVVFRRVMQERSIPFRDNRAIIAKVGNDKNARRPRFLKNCVNKKNKWADMLRMPKLPDASRLELRDKFVDLMQNLDDRKEKVSEFLSLKDL